MPQLMTNRASFHRVFSAAHRVWNDSGKCRNIHGHNYTVTVDVESERLTEQGFTIPFDTIKTVIDQFDHALVVDAKDPLLPKLQKLGVNVVDVPCIPSTENLAQLIADSVTFGEAGITVRVSLRETDGILAFGESSS